MNNYFDYLGRCIHLFSKRKVVFLNYHQVLSEKDKFQPNEPDIKDFIKQLDFLNKHFSIVPIESVFEGDFKYGKKPKIVLTFDDGYRNNYDFVLPELIDRKLSGVFFVVKNTKNVNIMWNDIILHGIKNYQKDKFYVSVAESTFYFDSSNLTQFLNTLFQLISYVKYLDNSLREEFIMKFTDEFCLDIPLPENLMLSNEQIKEMSDVGMTIGAHACSHAVLSTLTDDMANSEIVMIKDVLEGIIGKAVDHYAYPNGWPEIDFNSKHMKMVQSAGYKTAFSIQWGGYEVGDKKINMFNIPRVTPWRKNMIGFFINVIEPFLRG